MVQLPAPGSNKDQYSAVQFALRSTPSKISMYLDHVHKLVMDVLDEKAAAVGTIELDLANAVNAPIDKWVNVLSHDRRALGQIRVVFRVTFFHEQQESSLNSSFLANEQEAGKVGVIDTFPNSTTFVEATAAAEAEIVAELVSLFNDSDTLSCAVVSQWASTSPKTLAWIEARGKPLKTSVKGIEQVAPAIKPPGIKLSSVSAQQLSSRLYLPKSSTLDLSEQLFSLVMQNVLTLPAASNDSLIHQLWDFLSQEHSMLTSKPHQGTISWHFLVGALAALAEGPSDVRCRAIFSVIEEMGSMSLSQAVLCFGLTLAATDTAQTSQRLKGADVTDADIASSAKSKLSGSDAIATPPVINHGVNEFPIKAAAGNDPLDALLDRGQKLLNLLDNAIQETPTDDLGLGVTTDDILENDMLARLLQEADEEEDNRLINEYIGSAQHEQLKEKAPRVMLDPSSKDFEFELQSALDEITACSFTVSTLRIDIDSFPHCTMQSLFTIEYRFPKNHSAETPSDGVYRARATQLIPGEIQFEHWSVFGVSFDSETTEQWSTQSVDIRVFYSPTPPPDAPESTKSRPDVLCAHIQLPLRSVFLSPDFCCRTEVELTSFKSSQKKTPLARTQSAEVVEDDLVNELIAAGKQFLPETPTRLELCIELLKDLYSTPSGQGAGTQTAVSALGQGSTATKTDLLGDAIDHATAHNTIGNIVPPYPGNSTKELLVYIGELKHAPHMVIAQGESVWVEIKLHPKVAPLRSAAIPLQPYIHFGMTRIMEVDMDLSMTQYMREGLMIVEVWCRRMHTVEDELIGLLKLPLVMIFQAHVKQAAQTQLLQHDVVFDGLRPLNNPLSASNEGYLELKVAFGAKGSGHTFQQQLAEYTAKSAQGGKSAAVGPGQSLLNKLEQSIPVTTGPPGLAGLGMRPANGDLNLHRPTNSMPEGVSSGPPPSRTGLGPMHGDVQPIPIPSVKQPVDKQQPLPKPVPIPVPMPATTATNKDAGPLPIPLPAAANNTSSVIGAVPSTVPNLNMPPTSSMWRRQYGFDQLELTKILEFFRLEAQGKPALSLSDFQILLQQLTGVHYNSEVGIALSTALFDLFDTNRTKTLDLHEVLAGLALLCRGSLQDRIGIVFFMFDADHNGLIDRYELQAMLKWLLPHRSESDVQSVSAHVLQSADWTGNGCLSYHEFSRCALSVDMVQWIEQLVHNFEAVLSRAISGPYSGLKTSAMHGHSSMGKNPMASVGIDTVGDGIADTLVTGTDFNHDGIPDQLQHRIGDPSLTVLANETLAAIDAVSSAHPSALLDTSTNAPGPKSVYDKTDLTSSLELAQHERHAAFLQTSTRFHQPHKLRVDPKRIMKAKRQLVMEIDCADLQVPANVISEVEPWLHAHPFFFTLIVQPGDPNSCELMTACRVISDMLIPQKVTGMLELSGKLVQYMRHGRAALELRVQDNNYGSTRVVAQGDVKLAHLLSSPAQGHGKVQTVTLNDRANQKVSTVKLRLSLESAPANSGASFIDRFDQPVTRRSLEDDHSFPFPYRHKPDGSFVCDLPVLHRWRDHLSTIELDALLGLFHRHCGSAWGSCVQLPGFIRIFNDLLGPHNAGCPQTRGAPRSIEERELLVDRLFKMFDHGQDGLLGFRELVLGVSILCRGTARERLWLIFNLLDEDGKGELSKKELTSFLNKITPKIIKKTMEDAVKNIWPYADRQGHGKLKFQDFLKSDLRHVMLEWLQTFTGDFEQRFQKLVQQEQDQTRALASKAMRRSQEIFAPKDLDHTKTPWVTAPGMSDKFDKRTLESLAGLFQTHLDTSNDKTRLSKSRFSALLSRLLGGFIDFTAPNEPMLVINNVYDLFKFERSNSKDQTREEKDEEGISWHEFITGLGVLVKGNPAERLQLIFELFACGTQGYEEIIQDQEKKCAAFEKKGDTKGVQKCKDEINRCRERILVCNNGVKEGKQLDFEELVYVFGVLAPQTKQGKGMAERAAARIMSEAAKDDYMVGEDGRKQLKPVKERTLSFYDLLLWPGSGELIEWIESLTSDFEERVHDVANENSYIGVPLEHEKRTLTSMEPLHDAGEAFKKLTPHDALRTFRVYCPLPLVRQANGKKDAPDAKILRSITREQFKAVWGDLAKWKKYESWNHSNIQELWNVISGGSDRADRVRVGILFIAACTGSAVEKWMCIWRLMDESLSLDEEKGLSREQIVYMLKELWRWDDEAVSENDAGWKTFEGEFTAATKREFTPLMSFEQFERWTRETMDDRPLKTFMKAMSVCCNHCAKAVKPSKEEKEATSMKTDKVIIAGASGPEEAVQLWVIIESAHSLEIPQQHGTLYVELGSNGAGGPLARTRPVPISEAPEWNHSCHITVLGGTRRLCATLYRSTPLDGLIEAGAAPGGVLQRPLVGKAFIDLSSLAHLFPSNKKRQDGLFWHTPAKSECDIVINAHKIGSLKVEISCVDPSEHRKNQQLTTIPLSESAAGIRSSVQIPNVVGTAGGLKGLPLLQKNTEPKGASRQEELTKAAGLLPNASKEPFPVPLKKQASEFKPEPKEAQPKDEAQLGQGLFREVVKELDVLSTLTSNLLNKVSDEKEAVAEKSVLQGVNTLSLEQLKVVFDELKWLKAEAQLAADRALQEKELLMKQIAEVQANLDSQGSQHWAESYIKGQEEEFVQVECRIGELDEQLKQAMPGEMSVALLEDLLHKLLNFEVSPQNLQQVATLHQVILGNTPGQEQDSKDDWIKVALMLAVLSQPTRQSRMRALFCMIANADNCITQSELNVIFVTLGNTHCASVVRVSKAEISAAVASLFKSASSIASGVSIEDFERWPDSPQILEWLDSYTTAMEQLLSDQGFDIDFVHPINPGSSKGEDDNGSNDTEGTSTAPQPMSPLCAMLCLVFHLSTSRLNLSREDTLHALKDLPHNEVFVFVAFEAAQQSTVPWWWVALVVSTLVETTRSARLKLLFEMVSVDGNGMCMKQTDLNDILFAGLIKYKGNRDLPAWEEGEHLTYSQLCAWDGHEAMVSCLDAFTTKVEGVVCQQYGALRRTDLLHSQLVHQMSEETQEGIKAGLVRTQMEGTVSEETQEGIKAGLVRTRMEGTVSEETQESIKAGLVRTQMEGTVSEETQESIKAGLVRTQTEGVADREEQETQQRLDKLEGPTPRDDALLSEVSLSARGVRQSGLVRTTSDPLSRVPLSEPIMRHSLLSSGPQPSTSGAPIPCSQLRRPERGLRLLSDGPGSDSEEEDSITHSEPVMPTSSDYFEDDKTLQIAQIMRLRMHR